MNILEFKQLPILGILRGIGHEHIEPLTQAVINSGLKTIEITMNTDDAPELIKEMVRTADGRLTVGAGTVLNMGDMHQALDAGATFIVSPTFVPDVTRYCSDHSIPVFPGAFTPQEVLNAWNGGATMVKVFPTKALGPAYIKELKGPLDHIELMPCGGVNTDTVEEFFRSGASAVGFGGSIFRKEWMEEKKYGFIEDEIKKLVDSVFGLTKD